MGGHPSGPHHRPLQQRQHHVPSTEDQASSPTKTIQHLPTPGSHSADPHNEQSIEEQARHAHRTAISHECHRRRSWHTPCPSPSPGQRCHTHQHGLNPCVAPQQAGHPHPDRHAAPDPVTAQPLPHAQHPMEHHRHRHQLQPVHHPGHGRRIPPCHRHSQPRHHHRRWKRKPHERRQRTPHAPTLHPKAEAQLAARRPRQELTKRHPPRKLILRHPPQPLHERPPEIADMRHRPPKRNQSQSQELPEHAQYPSASPHPSFPAFFSLHTGVHFAGFPDRRPTSRPVPGNRT